VDAQDDGDGHKFRDGYIPDDSLKSEPLDSPTGLLARNNTEEEFTIRGSTRNESHRVLCYDPGKYRRTLILENVRVLIL